MTLSYIVILFHGCILIFQLSISVWLDMLQLMHSPCSGYSSINPNIKLQLPMEGCIYFFFKYQIVEYFDFFLCMTKDQTYNVTTCQIYGCYSFFLLSLFFCFYHWSEFCLYFLVIAWNGQIFFHRLSKPKDIFIDLVGAQTECDCSIVTDDCTLTFDV